MPALFAGRLGRRLLPVVAALSVAAFGCAPPAALRYALRGPAAEAELGPEQAAAEISGIIKASGFQPADFSIDIADLSEKGSFFSLNPEREMVLASNAKVVTAAAALEILGEDFRFRTEVLFHQGGVWVRGGGDPSLSFRHLREIARKIRIALGRREFNGIVSLDDGFFESQESINPEFSQASSFNAALGPLSVDRNSVMISLTAAAPREGDLQPLSILVKPDPEGFRVAADTAAVGFVLHHTPQFEVGFDEGEGIHLITLLGPLGEKSKGLAVRRAAVHFGRMFKEAARAEGLAVRQVAAAPVPEGAEKLFVHQSPPLNTILSSMLLESDNFLAEMIVMALAAEAGQRTHRDGVARLAEFLRGTAGLKGRPVGVANGSGLSRERQLSSRDMTDLLRFIEARPRISAAFTGVLATAGWSGTLYRRMQTPPALLHASAKTGMIDYVSCLSGFAAGPGSRRFAFSILINDLRSLKRTAKLSWLEREGESEWRRTTNVYNRQKAVQDQIVGILTRLR